MSEEMPHVPSLRTMPLWFQLALCVGVVAVSAASVAYTWQVWHRYELESRAAQVCTVAVASGDYTFKEFNKITTKQDVEMWMARRSCIIQMMGQNVSEN